MLPLLILLALLLAVDLAAWRWGVDSRERVDDVEWQRRRLWPTGDSAPAAEPR